MYFAVASLFCLLLIGWSTALLARWHSDDSYCGFVPWLSVFATVGGIGATSLAIWLYPIGSYGGVVLLYFLSAAPIAVIPTVAIHKATTFAVLPLIFMMIADPIITTGDDSVMAFLGFICFVLITGSLTMLTNRNFFWLS